MGEVILGTLGPPLLVMIVYLFCRSFQKPMRGRSHHDLVILQKRADGQR